MKKKSKTKGCTTSTAESGGADFCWFACVLLQAVFEHFAARQDAKRESAPFIVAAGCRSTARATSSDCALRCAVALRSAANADSNLSSYFRIHWPELRRVQEVVDTTNKLRRESRPDYRSVDLGKPAKTGSILALPDFLKCPESRILYWYASLQKRPEPADSELPMHR